jgi:aminopeptidase-like protein
MPRRFSSLIDELAGEEHRRSMSLLMQQLFPLCRSLTGDGVRQTLQAVAERLPALAVHEVPSGTAILDWTVPQEWRFNDAYVVGPDGTKVIDASTSNLHLVGYSTPIRATMPLNELRPHLHTLPDRPGLVPYRTSYWNPSWGFCLSQETLDSLPDGNYEVVVDTELFDGHLSYGELVIAGATDEEVLLTTHVCHPSLANDNLSGIALLCELGQLLGTADPRYTYRLLFIPGTVGSIAWLAEHRDEIERIRHGLVFTGVADHHALAYKRSRQATAVVDRAAGFVLPQMEPDTRCLDWYPYGYDERQFCSPGFDLPVGRLTRGVHGEYPEYHTSADDLTFAQPDQLVASVRATLEILSVLEGNARYVNTAPYGEPQLGRRGLYRAVGGAVDKASYEMGVLWVLSLSDGDHDLLEIAQRSNLPFSAIREAADQLINAGLLAEKEQ